MTPDQSLPAAAVSQPPCDDPLRAMRSDEAGMFYASEGCCYVCGMLNPSHVSMCPLYSQVAGPRAATGKG